MGRYYSMKFKGARDDAECAASPDLIMLELWDEGSR